MKWAAPNGAFYFFCYQDGETKVLAVFILAVESLAAP